MNRDNNVVPAPRRSFAPVALTGFLLTVAGNAMAFDETSILTAITDNTATAVLIVGAIILGVWTLRSMGLLKGRG